jgi:hypothetical protein
MMIENCFYCGKEILSDLDEVVIGAGKNKEGETDYLVYCIDCTETVKKLKEENDMQVKLTAIGLIKQIKLKKENEQLKSEHKQLLEALISIREGTQKYEDESGYIKISLHKYPNIKKIIEQITKKKWSKIKNDCKM